MKTVDQDPRILNAPSDQAKVRRRSQHAAIIGPDFTFAEFHGCCEVNGIGRSEEYA
jgi:hypothetical protein